MSSIPRGDVYFILDEAARAIKIGWSTNVPDRLSALQTASSTKLILLGTRPGAAREEARIHAKFKSTRMSGEWFHVTDALIAFIDRYTTTTKERENVQFKVTTARFAVLPQKTIVELQPTMNTPPALVHAIAGIMAKGMLDILAISFTGQMLMIYLGFLPWYALTPVSILVLFAVLWIATYGDRNARTLRLPPPNRMRAQSDNRLTTE